MRQDAGLVIRETVQCVGRLVAISDLAISRALSAHLQCYPDEAVSLSEPVKLLAQGTGSPSPDKRVSSNRR